MNVIETIQQDIYFYSWINYDFQCGETTDYVFD